MRILLVTDAHLGRDKKKGVIYLRHGTQAERLLGEALSSGRSLNVDMCIDLGDRAEGKDGAAESALENQKKVMEVYNAHAADIETHYVAGNHEMRPFVGQDIAQINSDITGTYAETYVRECEDASMVFWYANVVPCKDNIIRATQEDLHDLERALLAAKHNRVILFSHVPLDYHTQDVMPHNFKHYVFYKNTQEIWDVLDRANKQILNVAGHFHQSRDRERLGVTGQRFITLPSLVQGCKENHAQPLGAYTVMDVGEEKVSLRVFGKEPCRHTVQWAPAI